MKTVPRGKNTALIAYAPFVGFLIAFFINREENHPFATWHIKNMFGIWLMFFVAMVVMEKINVRLGDLLWFICLALWIYCWVMAFQNKKKGIPLLSSKFEEWFTFLG